MDPQKCTYLGTFHGKSCSLCGWKGQGHAADSRCSFASAYKQGLRIVACSIGNHTSRCDPASRSLLPSHPTLESGPTAAPQQPPPSRTASKHKKLQLPSPTPINGALGSGWGEHLGWCKSRNFPTTIDTTTTVAMHFPSLFSCSHTQPSTAP
jgi:hypothetical protein